MGVSGAGKTTVAQEVANLLGAPLVEGDSFHSESKKAKMRAAIPLTDEDRFSWLDTIVQEMKRTAAPVVIGTCSALRRMYRERLMSGLGDPVLFVYLHVDRAVLEHRVRTRVHEFMSPDLLDSQIKTLEVPTSDEPAVTIEAADDEHTTSLFAFEKVRMWLSQKG